MSDEGANAEAHGRLFWVSLVIGWVVIGFGLVSLLTHARATHPPAFAAYIFGALFVHDFVLVPVVLAFGVVVGRRLPPSVRGPFLAAMIVSGVLILASYPALRGFGRLPGNPSLLPRDYAAGLLLALAVVWTVTVLVIVAMRRKRRAKATAVERVEGPAPEVDRPEEAR